MTSCIQTGKAVKPSTGIEGTYLFNTCDQAVFTFWCHDGTGDSACGTEKYFKRGRKMQPDERYFNKYSLPGNAAVHLGACNGTKRNVSFGESGANTYSCTNNDAHINDHIYITCKNGRKLPYQWRKKYARGDSTIVRLESGGNIFWINLETADFNRFTANATAHAPTVFNNRLCDETTIEANIYEKFKKDAIDKLNKKHKEQRIECLEELSRTKECEDFLKPENSGSLGVRG